MEKKCEIVQDIIPLYSDGCASPATEEYISSHIEECSECRAYLQSYKRASVISARDSVSESEYNIDIDLPYQHLAKRIQIRRRRNRAYTVGAVIASAIALTYLADKFLKKK